MSRPRVAVIVFPGGNCELETARSVENARMSAELFRWNRDSGQLADFDGYVVGGGFSYQDRVRAGVIAAKEPIVGALVEAAAAGKPVLGICNGAQVLVESGLVPGIAENSLEMALAPNRMLRGGHVVRQGYYSSWARLRNQAKPGRCAFNIGIEAGELLPIPFAHAEGRFTTADESVKKSLLENALVVFAYSTPAGEAAVDFPDNPNGSLFSAAAVCNPAGNVMAIMPHPERSEHLGQVPGSIGGDYGERRRAAQGDREALLGPGPGRKLFDSMRRFLEES